MTADAAMSATGAVTESQEIRTLREAVMRSLKTGIEVDPGLHTKNIIQRIEIRIPGVSARKIHQKESTHMITSAHRRQRRRIKEVHERMQRVQMIRIMNPKMFAM